jgi:hypothetical protein
MASSRTWFILVDQTFQSFGKRSTVLTSNEDNIDDLKRKVKEACPNDIPHDYRHLTVWKLKGASMMNKFTHNQRMMKIHESIEANDEDIEELNEADLVSNVNVGPSDGQLLLVQLRAVTLSNHEPLGDPIESNVDEDPLVRGLIVQAEKRGSFAEKDVNSNRIEDAGEVPEFVQMYEAMLNRKREVSHSIPLGASYFEETFKDYFDPSTEDSSQSTRTAQWGEVRHLINISFVNEKSWDTLHRKRFKEADANWLLFYPIADYFQSISDTWRGSKFTVKLGESWPLHLIIRVGIKYFTYTPRSDFLVLKYGLPRVAVEVNSTSPGTDLVDRHRLLVQGASIVRFANGRLSAYQTKKNYIFMAIYISHNTVAECFFLYQDNSLRDDPQDVVSCKTRSFNLSIEGDRLRFVLQLYNLASALDTESGDERTKVEVQKIKAYVDQLGKKHGMETFASRKRRATHDSDGENQHSAHRKRGDGGAVEQLEGCGYEVVPDVFETDGGTWESITKLPPHIYTVFRRSDPKKTELIAKQVRERSDELYILKFLRTIRPQSPHVISFIEAIPSITGGWLILPKLHSIGNQVLMDSCSVSRRVQLGWDLIKGLAYLHEHKVAHGDIKPDNLVCDNTFRLQIIDFDVAMEVQDENTEIDKYRGTKGWTAPEMGEQDGPTPMYSPIKADRWSCGRVLLRHIMVRKRDNRLSNRLSKFADQLMAKDPQQRPSLLEWDKRPAAPLANVLKDGGKESRTRQEMVEGGSMKPPSAKKPRRGDSGD